jgi:hypothetical protein
MPYCFVFAGKKFQKMNGFLPAFCIFAKKNEKKLEKKFISAILSDFCI